MSEVELGRDELKRHLLDLGLSEDIAEMIADMSDYEGRKVAEDFVGSIRVSTVRMPALPEQERYWQTMVFGTTMSDDQRLSERERREAAQAARAAGSGVEPGARLVTPREMKHMVSARFETGLAPISSTSEEQARRTHEQVVNRLRATMARLEENP